MSKKKNKEKDTSHSSDFDPNLLREYMMGAINPGSINKFEMKDDVVDLHLGEQHVGKGKISPQDALFHQLDEFEKAIDKAIASGKLEIRVVHGLGKGKLKEEIYKILVKHPQVKSYQNEYSSRYGYGSTVIYFY